MKSDMDGTRVAARSPKDNNVFCQSRRTDGYENFRNSLRFLTPRVDVARVTGELDTRIDR